MGPIDKIKRFKHDLSILFGCGGMREEMRLKDRIGLLRGISDARHGRVLFMHEL